MPAELWVALVLSCIRCSVRFPCTSTQLWALQGKRIAQFFKNSSFHLNLLTSIFYSCLYNSEYTEVCGCSHSQESRRLKSGDRAGQLIGPPRPIHRTSKGLFRCQVTTCRRQCGAPPCENRTFWCWRRGRSFKWNEKRFCTETLGALIKTVLKADRCPHSPKVSCGSFCTIHSVVVYHIRNWYIYISVTVLSPQ